MKRLLLGLIFILMIPGVAFAQRVDMFSLGTGNVWAPAFTETNPGYVDVINGASSLTPVTGAGVSQITLKATSGNFYDAYITSSVSGYLFIFNTGSAVSNGTVTAGTSSGDYQDCITVPAGVTQGISTFGLAPEAFNSGITLAFSSTGCGTLTLQTALFIKGRYQ